MIVVDLVFLRPVPEMSQFRSESRFATTIEGELDLRCTREQDRQVARYCTALSEIEGERDGQWSQGQRFTAQIVGKER